MNIMPIFDASVLNSLPLGRLLGVDFGEKRMGLALCDPMQTIASSLKTLVYLSHQFPCAEIADIVQEQNVIAVIVGLPLHMNGRAGDKATLAAAFADALSGCLKTPVYMYDERWTTVSAHKSLQERGKSPSKHRDRVDQIAAAFLLQSFLDRLQHHRKDSARARTQD